MERNLKHSDQRDALTALLSGVKTHPTAEWLYGELKKSFPKISLATVYRNLNLLCSCGAAVKIEVGDGKDHYDANTKNHYHFLCKSCGRVIDVSDGEYSGINLPVQQKFGFTVDTHSVVFYGICDQCR